MPNLTLTEPELGDSLSHGVSEDLCLSETLCQAKTYSPQLMDVTLTDDGHSIQEWDNAWQSLGYDSGYDTPGNLDFNWGKLSYMIDGSVMPLIKALVAQGASPVAAAAVVAAKNPGTVNIPGAAAIQTKMPIWGWIALVGGGVVLLSLLGVIAFKK